jgi:hypothetical protein
LSDHDLKDALSDHDLKDALSDHDLKDGRIALIICGKINNALGKYHSFHFFARGFNALLVYYALSGLWDF